MIALGGLTGAWLLSRSGETQTVLVVAQAVARGEAVTATDLTTTELPVDVLNVRTVPSTSLDEVVGAVATADLLAGTVLTPDSITEELVPGPGNSVVGVALTWTQMPGQPIGSGDHVRFVATPPVGGEMPAADPETIEAVVINTQATDAGWLVNVELPTSSAPQLAALAATARIALVIDTVG
ncbi:SAF domain-containing protein [Occultella kanbiaonis]|uniref:SAF domain-containing protein n=1 Tax=Occultella kanbiaonis TaxID=2675754 RepID=UPI00143DF5CD|nr:SAF domain-containing protein [Occultella kanbiaonis]